MEPRKAWTRGGGSSLDSELTAAVLVLLAWGLMDAWLGLFRAPAEERAWLDLLLGPALLVALGGPFLALRAWLLERGPSPWWGHLFTALACVLPAGVLEAARFVPDELRALLAMGMVVGVGVASFFLRRDDRLARVTGFGLIVAALALTLELPWQLKPWLRTSVAMVGWCAMVDVLRRNVVRVAALRVLALWVAAVVIAGMLWMASMPLRWFVVSYTGQQNLLARPLMQSDSDEARGPGRLYEDLAKSSQRAARSRPDALDVDVVFVGIDAWRADHSETMVQTREALGATIEFERAVAPAPRTVFSLGAMTRARSVAELSFDEGVDPASPPSVAGAVRELGLEPVFIPTHRYLDESHGIAAGFRHQRPAHFERVYGRVGMHHGIIPATEVFATALEVSAKQPQPLLLWTHLMESHEPYHHDEGVGPRSPVGYRHALEDLDTKLASFVQAFEASRPRPVLWVLFGDHGEAFGQRGMHKHSTSLFDDQIRVSAWLRLPGRPAQRVSAPISIASLTSTVLEYLGGDPQHHASAPSVLACLDDPQACPEVAKSELIPFGSVMNHLIRYTTAQGYLIENPDAQAWLWVE